MESSSSSYEMSAVESQEQSIASLRSSVLPPAPLDTTVVHVFPSLSEKPKTCAPFLYSLWIALLGISTFVAIIAPVAVMFIFDIGSPPWFTIALTVITILLVLLLAPTWGVLCAYRPTTPVSQEAIERALLTAIPVDVVITTYTENLDEIAGTLAAIQNLEWHGPVHVYVLDDARREDVSMLCKGMRGARFPVAHITRANNEGKKGGNLNNFLNNVPQTADFFVTLDCDMRPFPNMLQLLFAEFISQPEQERRCIGFIQSPQFFRNYATKYDPFDVCSMHFIKTILPAMSALSTVPYIGTSALWRREALDRAGGFIIHHATEDVVTGCKVHQTTNEYGEKYISKYCPAPVAAGLSPRTLAELLDQRIRWNIGLVQMAAYHKFFIFCKDLRFIQRLAYFATCGGWMRNLPLFVGVFLGTLFINVSSTYLTLSVKQLYVPPIWYSTICVSTILPSLLWLLLPGSTMRARLSSVQMGFVYASTELVGVLYALGLPVSIRHASDSQSARWHPHFLFHGITYLLVLASSATAVGIQATSSVRNAGQIAQTVLLLALWSIVYMPIVFALCGYKAREDAKWLTLEDGRVDLFDKTVWSEVDSITFQQLKQVVERLVERLEHQDRVLKALTSEGRINYDSESSSSFAHVDRFMFEV